MPQLTYQCLPLELPRPLPEVLRAALNQPFVVFFDSAGGGESWLSFAPAMLLQCEGRNATLRRGAEDSRFEGDPLEAFERVERFTAQECPLAGETPAGFCGGWAGLLGYDLRTSIEKLMHPKPGGPLFPDLQAGFYPWALRLPAQGTPELRLLAGVPGGPQDIRALAAELAALFAGKADEPEPSALETPTLTTGREGFIAGVRAVQAAIREGEIYQANLTREVSWRGEIDPVETYLRLRRLNPAPFGGFLDCGQVRSVLSSSPESFLDVRQRRIVTRPIKGTRPRGSTPTEDARLRDELAASGKDRAELTMIVDLERNDLSRVCVPGTVKVPELYGMHSFERVHHLQATVEGVLKEGTTPTQIIRATFPGGSITGAPKKRAMEILWDLEPVRRGPYTGSLFWLATGGDMQANILIRTILREPGRVSFHVGGGITAYSDPAAEWDETLAKAAALHEVLAGNADLRSAPLEGGR